MSKAVGCVGRARPRERLARRLAPIPTPPPPTRSLLLSGLLLVLAAAALVLLVAPPLLLSFSPDAWRAALAARPPVDADSVDTPGADPNFPLGLPGASFRLALTLCCGLWVHVLSTHAAWLAFKLFRHG